MSYKIDSTTLFTSQAGQGLGSFTLSDTIQNYRTIEVEFRDSDGNEGLTSFKVIPGTNKTLITTFQPGWSSDKTYYIKSAIVSFTGTSASIDACKEGGMPNGSSPTVGVDSSTIIKIYSVTGYK